VLAAALFGALGLGGCSYALESMSSKSEMQAKPAASASQPADERADDTAAAEPEEADLAYARAAAADVLGRGAKANSVHWQNPQTGVSGNITPLATTHSEGGLPCRDFLASYVRAGAQSWLQGSACRTARGEWEVRTLKPLKSG
jgi:surface antigen